MPRHSALLLAILAAVSMPSCAEAEAIAYRTIERSLPMVLHDLSDMLHVSLTMTHGDSILVRNWSVEGEEADVVDRLAAEFRLLYVFNGLKYDFIPAADVITRTVPVPADRVEAATAAIHALYPRMSASVVKYLKPSYQPREILTLGIPKSPRSRFFGPDGGLEHGRRISDQNGH